jgi:hypothetical protein
MLRFITTALKIICFAAGFGWLALVAMTYARCPIFTIFGHECSGEQVDAWLVPFASGPIGLPALTVSIAIIAVGVLRRRGKLQKPRS